MNLPPADKKSVFQRRHVRPEIMWVMQASLIAASCTLLVVAVCSSTLSWC